MSNIRTALIVYGLENMTKSARKILEDLPPPRGEVPHVDWSQYELLLGVHSDPEPILTSIFHRIHLTGQSPSIASPSPIYYPAHKLALAERTIFPLKFEEAQSKMNLPQLAANFKGEYHDLLERYGEDETALFESFYHLYRKWAWGLPCAYDEAGVSLFEQWKAVAALVFASGQGWEHGPAKTFTLVGGDFPGIQDFVYTITSKGAAKGLRGRSFFIQLLGDAIIRRILSELKLSPANVIYAAGGNFMILAPSLSAKIGEATVAGILSSLVHNLESSLLQALQGDLSICLAWNELDSSAVGSHAFADSASRVLKEKIAQMKRQRYQAIAAERWEDIFGAQGKPGNRYCVICQQPLGVGEGIELEGQANIPQDQRERRCNTCHGFQQLAEKIGVPGLWGISNSRPAEGGQYWQQILWQIARKWYEYGDISDLAKLQDPWRYTVNNTDFLQVGAHGFRFIANITPRVTQQDVARYNAETDHDADDLPPIPGTIRTFSQMADSARGVHRLGVLRMDVDNLGQIMVHGLKPRTLAATSALSAALDLFFTGYLNQICQQVEKQISGADGERLYAIYAGGDDLFIVGSWDLIPGLAETVQQQFKAYTCQNPDLHISAGITLEERKFPLYQAAERAGRAEAQAKGHKKNGSDKDSLSFLGLPVKWADWQHVIRYLEEILSALEGDQAPKALVQVLQDIYTQYLDQIQEHNQKLLDAKEKIPDEIEYQIYYGPWMWRSGYALSRMCDRLKEARIKNIVLELQRASIDKNHIRYIGLAARWAELLSKKED